MNEKAPQEIEPQPESAPDITELLRKWKADNWLARLNDSCPSSDK